MTYRNTKNTRLLTALLSAAMTAAGALAPATTVFADEPATAATSAPAATAATTAAAIAADPAAQAALAAQQAALLAQQAHAAALAVDLRGFIGQNPDTIATNIGDFTPYSGMIEGSYYTDGAVEFWGTPAQGIRSLQIIAPTTANIGGVTYGMSFPQAKAVLKAGGWIERHTGGRRCAFRDPAGNLLSLAYNADKNQTVFWINYLKIY